MDGVVYHSYVSFVFVCTAAKIAVQQEESQAW